MTTTLEQILGPAQSDHEVITVKTVGREVNSYRVVEVLPDLPGPSHTPRTFLLPESEATPSKQRSEGYKVVLLNQHSAARLVSQTAPELVTSLLDAVSPEVRTGMVVVKGIIRMPGVRTKVAVASTDPDQDPIAAVLGRSSNRTALLSNLLGGERVDVIAWHPNRHTFLKNALNPAPTSWLITRDRRAVVGVPGHLISAAVGEGGLNASLSARLAGLVVTVVKADDTAEALSSTVTEFLGCTPEDSVEAIAKAQAGEILVTVRKAATPEEPEVAPEEPELEEAPFVAEVVTADDLDETASFF